jgi:three-Cys-motif partner protein
MSRNKDFFGKFGPHSEHKLLLLRNYFEAWGHKLGLREGAGEAILYVDACAGRGMDDGGSYGSPLIAARAAAIAQASVEKVRGSPFRIQMIAIEAKLTLFRELASHLKPFGSAVRALRGTLEQHLGEIEREFPRTPALFFIDPFGLDPLQADTVKRVLAGDRHEALLLFADQAALRHFGVISTLETRAERRLRKGAEAGSNQPNLFSDDNEAANRRLAALADAAEQSREALDITKPNAQRILDAAFGSSDWLPIINDTPQVERRAKFLSLYSDRLREWGATHILQIPIVKENDVHAYTLIHASKVPKAYSTMKEAVEYALKRSPLPVNVIEGMRSQLCCDLNEVEDTVRRRFAGRRIRWAEDPANKRAPCIKVFVMEETAAFPFEMDELKRRLKANKLKGATWVYDFPELPSTSPLHTRSS